MRLPSTGLEGVVTRTILPTFRLRRASEKCSRRADTVTETWLLSIRVIVDVFLLSCGPVRQLSHGCLVLLENKVGAYCKRENQ